MSVTLKSSYDNQSTVVNVCEGFRKKKEFKCAPQSRSTEDHLTTLIPFFLAGVLIYRDFYIYQTFMFSVMLTYPVLELIWQLKRKCSGSESGSDSLMVPLFDNRKKYNNHDWNNWDAFFLRYANAGYIALTVWDVLYTLMKIRQTENNISWIWRSNEAYYLFELLALFMSSIIAEH